MHSLFHISSPEGSTDGVGKAKEDADNGYELEKNGRNTEA